MGLTAPISLVRMRVRAMQFLRTDKLWVAVLVMMDPISLVRMRESSMIMLMEPNCFLGDGGELSGDDTQAKSENPCGELLGDDTGAKFGVDVGRTDGEDS